MTLIRDGAALDAVRRLGLAKLLPERPRITVGMGTCGAGNGAEGIYHALARSIEQRGLDVQLVQTGCFGFCAEEPLVNVWCPGQPLVMFRQVRTDSVGPILDVITGKAIPDSLVLCKIEHWDHITAQIDYGSGHAAVPAWDRSASRRISRRICRTIRCARTPGRTPVWVRYRPRRSAAR